MNTVPLIRASRASKLFLRFVIGGIVACIAYPIAFVIFLGAALIDCVLPSRS